MEFVVYFVDVGLCVEFGLWFSGGVYEWSSVVVLGIVCLLRTL